MVKLNSFNCFFALSPTLNILCPLSLSLTLHNSTFFHLIHLPASSLSRVYYFDCKHTLETSYNVCLYFRSICIGVFIVQILCYFSAFPSLTSFQIWEVFHR